MKIRYIKIKYYCKALRCETIKNIKKLFSFISNLQTYYHLKLDFQKVDQHTGGKWFNPRHQTPQGQSIAKPGMPLWNILVGNVNMT